MAHPLELEFLEICQNALQEEWRPDVMKLGKPIEFHDGSIRPTLTGMEPGYRVLADKSAHHPRWQRDMLVEIAARTCQSRSRKIRGEYRKSHHAPGLLRAA